MVIKYRSNVVEDIRGFIKDNRIRSIWLDMDGVMMGSGDAITEIVNNIQGTNYKGSNIISSNFKEIWKQDPNGMDDNTIENLFRHEVFWAIVQWIDGCQEFIDEFRDIIKIVTKGTKENLFYKQIWLENQGFGDIPFIGMPFEISKSIINMDGLFIDDSAKNLLESNAPYKIQFLEYDDHMNNKREWTKDWHGLKMYRW